MFDPTGSADEGRVGGAEQRKGKNQMRAAAADFEGFGQRERCGPRRCK